MWIKPSEMPKDFWGHAWVVWRSRWFKGGAPRPQGVTRVQKSYQRFSTHGAYWNDGSERWESMNDEEFRIHLIVEPECVVDVFDEKPTHLPEDSTDNQLKYLGVSV